MEHPYIQVVDNHHYLGILLESKLSWTLALTYFAIKQIDYWDFYASLSSSFKRTGMLSYK